MAFRTASSAELKAHPGGRPPAHYDPDDAETSKTFREALAVCMARIDEVREAHGLLRRRGRLVAAWAALHAARERVDGPHQRRQAEVLERLVSILEGIDAGLRAETRMAWRDEEPATCVEPTHAHGERKGRGGRGNTQ